VLAAYRQLEDSGLLEARNRSGFYVKAAPRIQVLPPRILVTTMRPAPVTGQDMVLQLIKAANNPNIVQLGAAVPAPEFLPSRAIERALTQVARQHRVANYEFSPGAPELRQQLASRIAHAGAAVHPDNLVITNGCQEALSLALRAVTQPGDTVAIESPTFYGLLQVIESLGLEALEIPTNPSTGMSLEALELALSRWPVKACVITPNFSNPLGCCMPDEYKRKLVAMLKARAIVLIEDDIYGDLSFNHRRPSLLLGQDPEADVILCSSVSKTLSPGLRVGWIAPGRYQEKVEYMKYVLNLATAGIQQLAVAELLENGQYERHLRRVRSEYAQAVARMTEAIIHYFPEGTKITRPQGGFVIWLELPGDIDTFALAHKALAQGISIAPGPIFSASQKYRSFIRLSCACVWGSRIERALATLAGLIAAY
jgi:DNA-binding transcriptional MocR family regulator